MQRSPYDTMRIEFAIIRDMTLAVSPEYATFHTSCGSSMSDDFWEWLKPLYNKSITERSNIGGSGVAGVFGSYNWIAREYVVQALWDGVKGAAVRPRNRLEAH